MYTVCKISITISPWYYVCLWRQLNDATAKEYTTACTHIIIFTLAPLNLLQDAPQYSISFHIHIICVVQYRICRSLTREVVESGAITNNMQCCVFIRYIVLSNRH